MGGCSPLRPAEDALPTHRTAGAVRRVLAVVLWSQVLYHLGGHCTSRMVLADDLLVLERRAVAASTAVRIRVAALAMLASVGVMGARSHVYDKTQFGRTTRERRHEDRSPKTLQTLHVDTRETRPGHRHSPQSEWGPPQRIARVVERSTRYAGVWGRVGPGGMRV